MLLDTSFRPRGKSLSPILTLALVSFYPFQARNFRGNHPSSNAPLRFPPRNSEHPAYSSISAPQLDSMACSSDRYPSSSQAVVPVMQLNLQQYRLRNRLDSHLDSHLESNVLLLRALIHHHLHPCSQRKKLMPRHFADCPNRVHASAKSTGGSADPSSSAAAPDDRGGWGWMNAMVSLGC